MTGLYDHLVVNPDFIYSEEYPHVCFISVNPVSVLYTVSMLLNYVSPMYLGRMSVRIV